MTDSSKKPAFYFHADANAIGGSLRQPLERIVSSHASVSLAQAGGFGHSRVGPFHVDGIVSCASASVRVSGTHDREHGIWRTLVTATVDRLNILEVVTAERIVAQLSVAHSRDHQPPRVSLIGTQFVGLRLGGVPVEPKPNPGLFLRGRSDSDREPSGNDALPTWESILDAAIEQRRAATAQERSPEWLGTRLADMDLRKDLEQKGSALCSVVHKLSVSEPLTSYAHVVHLPDFGNVFLGEFLVGRSCYQLTMLRVEMGCLAEGDLSVCTVFSNGRTMP